jgi:hypothetical protein
MPTYTASEPAKLLDFVEPGDYLVEVIDASETISRSGRDMIELKLRTSAGSIVYDHLVFTPNAFWKIDSFRVATGETIMPNQEVDVSADDLIGHTARVRLAVEEYNGRKRNKVAAWLAPVSGAASAPAPNTQQKGGSHGNPF